MNQLKTIIIDQIKNSGAITFYEFMHTALYHKNLGYYFNDKEKIGVRGDYYTSANVDASFGALLAKECLRLYNLLDSNSQQINILEIGAGTGQLAFDIIYSLITENNFQKNNIQYTICEISPTMQALQKEKLATFASQVKWLNYNQLQENPQIAIIIANEVVDAFAVHKVRFSKGELEELYLNSDGESLKPFWQKAKNAELEEYLRKLKIELIENQVIEINLDAIKWLKTLVNSLVEGFIINIDYGDLSDHLYSPENLTGTIKCFSKHQLNTQVFENIGEQDITSDVNFSALIYYGQEFGLENLVFTRQADFLIKLGLLERLEQLITQDPDSFNSLKTRLALKNFFVPGGISDHFKVLVQKKSKEI